MGQKLILFGDDPSGPTGFGRIVFHLAAAARAAGFEPVVVGLKKSHGAIDGALTVNAAERGDPRGFETFAKAVEEHNARVAVSVGDPWDVYGILPVRERVGFNWIACTAVDSTPSPRYLLLAREPHQYLDAAFLLRHADRIVTYSEFGRSAVAKMIAEAVDCAKTTPVPEILSIPLGVDTSVFSPRPKSESRGEFSGAVQDGTVMFSCVKTNSMRAGFDTLLAAWALYLEKARAADPELAGRSKLYLHTMVNGGAFPIILLMKRYGIENSIMLNPGIAPGGMVADETIAHVHNASDVAVSAARAEGFGLNILEALSCSVPAVVPDYGGPAEYGGGAVSRARISASFNPEFGVTDFVIVDVAAMAESMLDLAMDPVKRASMGAEGRRIAESMTWSKFEKRWAELIASTR